MSLLVAPDDWQDATVATLSVESVVEAINYADSKGIPILNLSGGFKDKRIDQVSSFAVAVSNYDGLLICAAGNEGVDITNAIDGDPVYPPRLNYANILVVGSSTKDDEKASNSNYSQTHVDIFAPGEDVISCTADGGHRPDSGTSYATAHVTGVAALLLSAYPNLSAADLKHIIMGSVDQSAAFEDLCVSGGRLNAYNALVTASTYPHYEYSYSNISVGSGHKCSCNSCVYTYTEPHTWMEFISFYKCSKCLVTSTHIAINSNDLPVELLGSTMPDEFSVSVDANTVLCRVDGQFYLVKGYSETAALQFLKNELSVSDSTVTE